MITARYDNKITARYNNKITARYNNKITARYNNKITGEYGTGPILDKRRAYSPGETFSVNESKERGEPYLIAPALRSLSPKDFSVPFMPILTWG